MHKFLISAAALVLGFLHGAPANAVSPPKVWVANYGADNGTCGPINSPCATFQQAHNNVAAGGEIAVLGPGDYGRLTISKAVTVSNDSAGEASIVNTNFAVAAITISAGRGDVVSLRGLVLDGAVLGADGIDVLQVGALHMQNCVIRNFEGAPGSRGLIATANFGNNMALFISDTIVFNNGASADSGGIQLFSQGGSINAVLNRVQLENNVIGLKVSASSAGFSARVTVRDSVIAGNAGDGLFATTSNGTGALVLVERTTLVRNAAIGVHTNGPQATVLLSDSTVSQNGTGVSADNGGQLISFGNNRNANNIGAEGTATGFLSANF